MKLDRKLNLVVPVDCANGSRIYVHSVPVSYEVFDVHFAVIAKTFTDMYTLGHIAGPRVADKVLRKVAQDNDVWEDKRSGGQVVVGVKNGLVAEIYRLTHIVAPGPSGWETVPYTDARQRGMISAEDAAEVDAAITFFTVASHMHRRQEMEMLAETIDASGAQTTPLNCTEYASSLTTSTKAASTGEKPVP